MSCADGVYSSTCLQIAEPCDRPSCSWCSCDEEPLADWERDLLNEANATATLTAQRDTARDIAARLEGECARAAEVCDAAWLWMLESGCDRRAPIMQRLRAIADGDPDAVIAEGES